MLLANAFDKLNSVMQVVAPDNASKYTGVQSFVNLVASVLVFTAFGLSLVALTYGFIQITTSTGDPKNMEKSQRTVVWGIIGMLVSLLAYVLKRVLFNSAGILWIK